MNMIIQAWNLSGFSMPPEKSTYRTAEYVQLLQSVGMKIPFGKFLQALHRIGVAPPAPRFLRQLKELDVPLLSIGEMQEWEEIKKIPRSSAVAEALKAQHKFKKTGSWDFC